MNRCGWVYIITNKTNSVLYTGVSSDLVSRIQKHIEEYYEKSFSAKYKVNKLVYYCLFDAIADAIAEEKRIKAGNRTNKIKLIESINPGWRDLWLTEVSKW
ncbi:MAG: GIY-YIG nuclease family protein [Flavisolibacter sp.]